MGFLHLYQQVCAPVGQGGEVLLESRFLVVGVGQMLEWGWVVCSIGCWWRAFQVGSMLQENYFSFFFISEVVRQISLGQQVLAQLVVGFHQVVRWVFLISI